MQDIVDKVNKDLANGYMPTQMIMSRLPYVTETMRRRYYFLDPRYYPFYYHLGKYLKPESMIDLNFDIGLTAASFMLSCKTVKHFIGFQRSNKDSYSFMMGKHNIKNVYNKCKMSFHNGRLDDIDLEVKLKQRQWDLAVLNVTTSYDEHLAYMRLIWRYISDGGCLILDSTNSHKPTEQSLKDFCKICNRDYFVFNSTFKAVAIIK